MEEKINNMKIYESYIPPNKNSVSNFKISFVWRELYKFINYLHKTKSLYILLDTKKCIAKEYSLFYKIKINIYEIAKGKYANDPQ